jgi:hypothetical protein
MSSFWNWFPRRRSSASTAYPRMTVTVSPSDRRPVNGDVLKVTGFKSPCRAGTPFRKRESELLRNWVYVRKVPGGGFQGIRTNPALGLTTGQQSLLLNNQVQAMTAFAVECFEKGRAGTYNALRTSAIRR